jgi:nucleoside-diphosphate-sugar epimerase
MNDLQAGSRPTILITGASGFIGRNLSAHLVEKRWQVRGMVRPGREEVLAPGVEPVQIEDLAEHTSLEKCLAGVDTVIHLAAMVPGKFASRREFFRVNLDGTAILAEAAVRAGVRRMIYLSSAKVHGEGHYAPYTESAPLAPRGSYAVSKLRSEQMLSSVAGRTGLEIVVLRPPVVYGPRVKGNFIRLLQFVEWGIPLPLTQLSPSRSMIYVGNLVDAIETCLLHPDADRKLFLLRDGEDLATLELLRRMAALMGREVRFLPFPSVGWLHLMLPFARISHPLRVDDSLIRKTLAWVPPFTCEEGLRRTVTWYLEKK